MRINTILFSTKKFNRYFRFFLGVAILLTGYFYNSLWGLIGLLPLLTAISSYLPLYTALEINEEEANREKKAKKHGSH